MNARNKNQGAHGSPHDIIDTFNHFFTNVPTNKSFEMTYKVYIRDLADTEDRGTLSTHSSLINVQGSQPTTIASYGSVPTVSTSSTSVDQSSYLSVPSTKSSSTDVSVKSPHDVTMTQIDRLCAENMARKDRSMLNLNELSKQLGESKVSAVAPLEKTPSAVYENLNILTPSVSTAAPKTPNIYTSVERDFSKLETKGSDGKCYLYVKVSDCFD